MVEHTRLDLYTMLSQGQEIWAQNRTTPLGILALTMSSGLSYRFPASKDPVCLSVLFSDDDLRRSQDLRNMTVKNALVLLTKEQAQAYFHAVGRPMAPTPVERKSKIAEVIRQDPEAVPTAQTAERVTASPQVVQLAVELQHPNLSDEDVISAISERIESLESTDLVYLLSQVQRKKVGSWLAKYISGQEAVQQDEEETLKENQDEPPKRAVRKVSVRKRGA